VKADRLAPLMVDRRVVMAVVTGDSGSTMEAPTGEAAIRL
jgi:hypothetical protein